MGDKTVTRVVSAAETIYASFVYGLHFIKWDRYVFLYINGLAQDCAMELLQSYVKPMMYKAVFYL